MIFIGADYNRWLQNYKITKFMVFCECCWWIYWEGRGDVKFRTFEGGVFTKITSESKLDGPFPSSQFQIYGLGKFLFVK